MRASDPYCQSVTMILPLASLKMWSFSCLPVRGYPSFFYLPLLATVAKVLSLASFKIHIYCIFVITNKCVVGWEKDQDQIKVCACQNK